MTLTYKADLDWVKMNHCVEYLGQRSLRSKVIARTHTHTHTTDRSHCRTTNEYCSIVLRRTCIYIQTVRSRVCSRAGCPWCSRIGRAAGDRRSTGRSARATIGPWLAAGTGRRSVDDIRSTAPWSARPSPRTRLATSVDARRYRRFEFTAVQCTTWIDSRAFQHNYTPAAVSG